DLRDLLRERAPELRVALEETIDSGRRVRNREVEILPPLPPTFQLTSPTVSSGEGGGSRDEAGGGSGDEAGGGSGDGAGPPHDDPLPVAVSTSALQGGGSSTSYVILLQDLRPVRQLEDLRLRTGRL